MNKVAVFALLLFLSVNARADDIKFECKKDDQAGSIYFRDIQEAARKINQDICDAILVPTRKSVTDGFPRKRVAAFGSLVREKIEAKKLLSGNTDMQKQLEYFEATLKTGDAYPIAMPIFTHNKGVRGPRDQASNFFFSGHQNSNLITPSSDDDKECMVEMSVSCSVVLGDLENAINPYQRNATAFTSFNTAIKLNELSQSWDAYFEKARAQTFADVTFTTFMESAHFKTDHLVGPPDRQWFLFHPNLVVENVQAAVDGENTKTALTIEWIGVNWWQDSIIGIPFGISATSLYSDRPGVDDIGWGATLYFDNKYVIGWASHRGQNGFYISMDVLKLFESKSSQVDKYREKAKGLLDQISGKN